MHDIIAAIKDIGFPIVVATLLLVRVEPTMRRIETTMSKILDFMNQHT